MISYSPVTGAEKYQTRGGGGICLKDREHQVNSLIDETFSSDINMPARLPKKEEKKGIIGSLKGIRLSTTSGTSLLE